MKNFKLVAFAGLALIVVLAGLVFWPSASQTGNDSAETSKPPAVASAGKPSSPGAAQKPGNRGKGGGRPPALVVTSTVSSAVVNDRLKAVGNGTARASVSVVPLSGGILSEVLVQPGQQVEKNSLLAHFDDEEQLIAKDRAELAVIEAKSDVQRLTKLFRSRTATEVELNRAKTALSDAQFTLRDATLKLERRTIKAPMDGIVGFVSVDEGNFVSAQTELMTIDDRSTIVVEFWIPARFANDVEVNQTIKAVALANPGVEHTGTIVGIGTRVEEDSRTLPVKASINNENDSLRPGMSFELSLIFDGDTYPAVNPLAIQWDSNGPYVWQVVENKAERVPVRIIQRNPESVLVNASLQSDDSVVIEGLLALRNGANVRVSGAGNAGKGKPQSEKPEKKPDNIQADKKPTAVKADSTS